MIEMIADQVKERFADGKRRRPVQCLAVAPRRRLLDERQQAGILARRLPVGRPVCRTDHQADFFNPGGDDLFEDDLQGRLLVPSRSTNRCSGNRPWSGPAAVMTAFRMPME